MTKKRSRVTRNAKFDSSEKKGCLLCNGHKTVEKFFSLGMQVASLFSDFDKKDCTTHDLNQFNASDSYHTHNFFKIY